MNYKQLNNSALVVFSGGQDSTTCLFWAKNRFDYVEAISFFYGQNHSVELEQAKKICQEAGIKQTIIDISFLNQIVDSALTSKGDVNTAHKRLQHLPASFVPNRNMLFLTLANSYAQKSG
jgi:7-cyano-7-deazaguanine synthase